MTPVVVKFGGGLMGSPERDAMLAAAARAGAIVAPGGGAFADAVRAEQAKAGFSDALAHQLAILAMDQTARIFGDIASLRLASTLDELRDAAAEGVGSVWLPSPLALAAPLPASWDVTSDSLALWLAITLKADRLVVLKAADVSPAPLPSVWSEAGLVDRHFPVLARDYPREIALVAPATETALHRALERRRSAA